MDCRWGVIILALLLCACGQGVQPSEDPPCDIRSGELLLTEWYVDQDHPAQQWLELHNISARSLSLHRLLMQFSPAEDALILRGEQLLPPGGYAVVGGQKEESFLDYRVDSLPLHRAQSVNLSCDGQPVLSWQLPAIPLLAGSSLSLTAEARNDSALAAKSEAWCPAVMVLADGGTATPGEQNPFCGTVHCETEDGWQTVPAMAADNLWLNEVVADPEGQDLNAEWFEVRSMSSQPQLLNGLQIRGAEQAWQLNSSHCLWIQPAQHLVLGVRSDPAASASITPDHWLRGAALPNRPQHYDLQVRGVEQRGLPAAAEVVSGLAHGWSGLQEDVQSCAMQYRSSRWDGSRYATPGELNDACAPACLDDAGQWQRLQPALPGELLLSEVMANPEGNDAGREWLELYLNASSPRHLNNLLVKQRSLVTGNERSWNLTSRQCVELLSHQYQILAADAAMAGLGQQVSMLPQLQLYNDASEVSLWQQEQLLDTAQLPTAVEGRSHGADFSQFDVTENDLPEQFCTAKRVRNANQGWSSPGIANDACGDVCWRDQVWSPLRSPVSGELLISEVVSNPSGADAGRDWLQLEVVATRTLDLNDLSLLQVLQNGSERRWQLQQANCLSAHAGQSLLLVGDGLTNLSLPTVNLPGLDMYSSDSGELRLYYGEQLIDTAYLGRGVSGMAQRLRAYDADNDSADSWCSVVDKLQNLQDGVSDALAPGC